jgi:hypothetical protein
MNHLALCRARIYRLSSSERAIRAPRVRTRSLAMFNPSGALRTGIFAKIPEFRKGLSGQGTGHFLQTMLVVAEAISVRS